MRKLFYVAMTAVLLGACSSGGEQGRNPSSRRLYEKSVKLLKIYTDKMSAAKDSATVHKLDSAYEADITKLNFAYDANTVLEISESENDTLSSMTIKFAAVRDSLLYRFAHPIVHASDSIAADTAKSAAAHTSKITSKP